MIKQVTTQEKTIADDVVLDLKNDNVEESKQEPKADWRIPMT